MLLEKVQELREVQGTICEVVSAVIDLWHNPEFLWLLSGGVEQRRVMRIDDTILATMDNQNRARRDEGNIAQRLNLPEVITCAPAKQVVSQPGKGSLRHMQRAPDAIINHTC